MTSFKKTLAAAAAALTMAVAFAPAAEAKFHRNGWLAAGLIGGAVIGTPSPPAAPTPPRATMSAVVIANRVRERVWTIIAAASSRFAGRFATKSPDRKPHGVAPLLTGGGFFCVHA